ncbi:MAG: hypothetical protein U5K74_13655 [Gemmatimonadaceae bacterium]|nr:hypothetical protein [Gemmatimonadaceae bacterium]
MSAMTVLFYLILIVLAALIGDHYSRLQKMGWAPQVEEYKRGRSLMDPIGSAFGELGRADAPFRLIAAAFDAIATVTGMVYAPIGAGLSAIGKVLELVFKPIGAVLGAITGFGLKH